MDSAAGGLAGGPGWSGGQSPEQLALHARRRRYGADKQHSLLKKQFFTIPRMPMAATAESKARYQRARGGRATAAIEAGMETIADVAAPEAATVLAEEGSIATGRCAAKAWSDGRIFGVGYATGKRNRNFQKNVQISKENGRGTL